jgi:hypothetical protein
VYADATGSSLDFLSNGAYAYSLLRWDSGSDAHFDAPMPNDRSTTSDLRQALDLYLCDDARNAPSGEPRPHRG